MESYTYKQALDGSQTKIYEIFAPAENKKTGNP